MARYLGPKCRLSRREKTDLQHKSGIRAIDKKCKIDRVPGQHWQRRGRVTNYGEQMRMKQIMRRFYNLLEKQFRKYYERADRMKGSTGDNLLRLLEARLDNVVYRLGFAATRAEARQLVTHKSVMVNGRVTNIPSLQLAIGDTIAIHDQSKKQLRILGAIELSAQRESVSWLEVDKTAMTGVFKDLPNVDELPKEFRVNLVVEYYSK